MAAKWKSDFHSRAEISNAALIAAGIMAALALILFLLSLRKKQG
jgi:LPXTG-motif cell wall-anchored protein